MYITKVELLLWYWYCKWQDTSYPWEYSLNPMERPDGIGIGSLGLCSRKKIWPLPTVFVFMYIYVKRERDICTYMIIFWWYWLRVGDDRLRSGWWERWPDICIGKGYICDTYACMSVCVNGFSVKWFSNFLKEYKSGFLTKPSFCLPLQSFEFIISRIHQIEFQQ